MPMRPRSGRQTVVRQRKSCCSSVALGCLKLKTEQPCGFTAGHDVLDGAVLARGRPMAWKMSSSACRFAGVEQALLLAEFFPYVRRGFPCSGPWTCRNGRALRRPFFKVHLFLPGATRKSSLWIFMVQNICAGAVTSPGHAGTYLMDEIGGRGLVPILIRPCSSFEASKMMPPGLDGVGFVTLDGGERAFLDDHDFLIGVAVAGGAASRRGFRVEM